MFSGGKVTNSKSTDFSSVINDFVQVIGDYNPSLKGLQVIAREAVKVGNTALRKASLGLQALTKSNGHRLVGMIHNPNAPKSIQPDRAQVLGSVLGILYQSPDSGTKVLAIEIAKTWFEGITRDIGIRGKYDNKKK